MSDMRKQAGDYDVTGRVPETGSRAKAAIMPDEVGQGAAENRVPVYLQGGPYDCARVLARPSSKWLKTPDGDMYHTKGALRNGERMFFYDPLPRPTPYIAEIITEALLEIGPRGSMRQATVLAAIDADNQKIISDAVDAAFSRRATDDRGAALLEWSEEAVKMARKFATQDALIGAIDRHDPGAAEITDREKEFVEDGGRPLSKEQMDAIDAEADRQAAGIPPRSGFILELLVSDKQHPNRYSVGKQGPRGEGKVERIEPHYSYFDDRARDEPARFTIHFATALVRHVPRHAALNWLEHT